MSHGLDRIKWNYNEDDEPIVTPQTSRELALKIVAECFKGVPAYPHFDEDHAIDLINAWVRVREAELRKRIEILQETMYEDEIAAVDAALATARKQLEEKVK